MPLRFLVAITLACLALLGCSGSSSSGPQLADLPPAADAGGGGNSDAGGAVPPSGDDGAAPDAASADSAPASADAGTGEDAAAEDAGGDGGAHKPCVPATALAVCIGLDGHPMNCGFMADGCGGLVGCGEADGGYAGACSPTTHPVFRGSNVCGCDSPTPPCTPTLTCADYHYGCGQMGDGCGNIIDCGTCPKGESCGAVAFGQCG